MNRETIIAIGFGIVLGAVVGVVVLFQTNKAEETKVIPIARESDQKKVISDENVSSIQRSNLIIKSPQSGSIVSKDTIEVVGSAEKKSLIVIQSPIAEEVFKNEESTFKVKIPLAVGENVIQVSAYLDTSTPEEQTLRIYYVPIE